MVSVDYGQDTGCVSDLPLRRGLVSSQVTLANAVARRITCPRGALAAIGDDPDYGYDLRVHLHAAQSDAAKKRIQNDVARECEKDERIQSVNAEITITGAGTADARMRIRFDIIPADELAPFSFVMAVSTLTVEILTVEV